MIQWFSDVWSHTECLLGWYHFCWRTALNSPSWCHWICNMPHANRLPAQVLSENLMAKSTVAMTHLPAGRAAESLPVPFWLLGPASPQPFPAHHSLLIGQLSFLWPFLVALIFFFFFFGPAKQLHHPSMHVKWIYTLHSPPALFNWTPPFKKINELCLFAVLGTSLYSFCSLYVSHLEYFPSSQ